MATSTLAGSVTPKPSPVSDSARASAPYWTRRPATIPRRSQDSSELRRLLHPLVGIAIGAHPEQDVRERAIEGAGRERDRHRQRAVPRRCVDLDDDRSVPTIAHEVRGL